MELNRQDAKKIREWNRRLTQMGAEAEKLTRRHGDTEVQKEN
jgi:hypothetical protein